MATESEDERQAEMLKTLKQALPQKATIEDVTMMIAYISEMYALMPNGHLPFVLQAVYNQQSSYHSEEQKNVH